jgi:hypothetical protein
VGYFLIGAVSKGYLNVGLIGGKLLFNPIPRLICVKAKRDLKLITFQIMLKR